MRALLLMVGFLAGVGFWPSVSAGEPTLDLAAGRLDHLPALVGESLGAEDLDGRVVVVTFFASWCPPCRSEFAHLNDVRESFDGANLTIVAVNVFENWAGRAPNSLEAFLEETAPAFFVIEGNPEVRDRFGGVDRIPSLFIFDTGGKLAHRFVHEVDAEKTHLTADELTAIVTPLLPSN